MTRVLLAAFALALVFPAGPSDAAVPRLLVSGQMTVRGTMGDLIGLDVHDASGIRLYTGGFAESDLMTCCLNCRMGTPMSVSLGGDYGYNYYNQLDFRVTDARGVETLYPEGTSFTMVAAARPIILPDPALGTSHTVTTPFVLTVFDPAGVMYSGSGIATVVLLLQQRFNNAPTDRWYAQYVVYELVGPPVPPPPPAPPRHPKHPR